MNYDSARTYLVNKPDSIEDHPFGPEVAVMKIKGKMFATLSYRNGDAEMNLKCDPCDAVQLRDIFEAVVPGYHMNKKHWNTVILNGSIPKGEIERMIDHSYGLVVKGLKKLQREGLEIKYGKKVIYRA